MDSNTPLLSAPSPSTPTAAGAKSPAAAAAAAPVNAFDQQAVYASQLSSHFSAFGTLFKSSAPIPLTESETEYVVNCIKHTFAKHIVFQFDCTNTLNDQLLENVHMVMQPEIDGLIQVAEIPAEKLEYGVTGVIYVAFEQEDPDELGNGNVYPIFCQIVYFVLTISIAIVSFTNTLTFEVKDCDPTTGEADPEGYNDEYQVEDVEVTTSDYIRTSYISNFAEEYENLAEGEVVDTFALDREKAPNLKGKMMMIIPLKCQVPKNYYLLFSCLYIYYRFIGYASFRGYRNT